MAKKLLVGATVIAVMVVVVAVVIAQRPVTTQSEYNPTINPGDFTTQITNPYFNLPVGKKMTYEARTRAGRERIQIEITGETRVIMGVTTLVYWDRTWLNNELIEETKDYLAQDRAGNVWYFGEDVDNYGNGQLKNHAGAWLAGMAGAQPGIWMKAKPRVGASYRQEYDRGEAEDMADIVGVNETVTTAYGTFTGCLKTYDWTPLDPHSREHKYYCPEVGGAVLTEHLVDEERTELIDVQQ